ncbi:HypC/HybG/HupF family hydrogenase formation chaperone [Candidatus Contubernalis alkaliaceticus]|uniref:HypC/HybG/HupF family hydrogenase formation chaperone n=1 Tax=Candidatus Contubernalis alkaliaceticus TaxID=338645 RepID=UPI001F4C2087|nr:HypC/HybG/HupF family hydrogenase formation chaperone [Candidatus Contubernalis alkalaceticus]UNC92292.1 HypC/HybG/HupF family hydrogenase formation chaperone [Candidatus Contubernalis alkalaceticus]
MCLGVPAKVMMINDENRTALVDSFGVSRWVGITLVPDVKEDDYVLIHAGYALEKIDLQDAEGRIKIWEEMLTLEEEL